MEILDIKIDSSHTLMGSFFIAIVMLLIIISLISRRSDTVSIYIYKFRRV